MPAGFDLLCALGFSIIDNLRATILTVATPWLQSWPSLFAGLGCLTKKQTGGLRPCLDFRQVNKAVILDKYPLPTHRSFRPSVLDCSAAIRRLKVQLTCPPLQCSPTLVTCDASNSTIGPVVSQLQGETERPVGFASRSLTPTEQTYSVGERKALVCVWACEPWHMYLYGRHFTL